MSDSDIPKVVFKKRKKKDRKTVRCSKLVEEIKESKMILFIYLFCFVFQKRICLLYCIVFY